VNEEECLEAALLRQAKRAKRLAEGSGVPDENSKKREEQRKARAKAKADQERANYLRNRVNREQS
jgi:hypothetical protein